MPTTALTRTRVLVGTVMAGATVVTAGVAASLALASTTQQADAAVDPAGPTQQATATTGRAPDSARTSTRKTAGQTFAPTRTATTASGPTHTKTKGS